MTSDHNQRNTPGPQGLYDPANEHDACGVNFVCDIHGRATHEIVAMGIGALCNMEHRGAKGADINTGDGAGILIQIPDMFLRDVVAFDLPPAGEFATGIAFLPRSRDAAMDAVAEVEAIVLDEGLKVLGWRDVPIDESVLGSGSLMTMPTFKQVFIAGDGLRGIELDRRLYVARKRIAHEVAIVDEEILESPSMGGSSSVHEGVYFPSLSSRTIVYKGMLTTPQLSAFYPDLLDARVKSALALVHSRFSTNTFPSWPLAHPYRMVAHNGEINTINGNRNWMRARESMLSTPCIPGLDRAFPICTPGASDTAGFDEALELLVLGGYPIEEAVMMMIPEPWEHHDLMAAGHRAFYQYNASRMEPWDGPASIAFTDGKVIGAVLDRNGLRPSRYWVTDDGIVVMASEVGVIDIKQERVVEKGRLQPGRMFLIDTVEGRIVRNDEIKNRLAHARPYEDWVEANIFHVDSLPSPSPSGPSDDNLLEQQQVFGCTIEEKKLVLAPMARDAHEALGSMGTDTPLAVLSQRPRLLSDYFQQLFAQVTNPPLDAIREELVTSLFARLGPEGNLFDSTAESCRTIHLDTPILRNDQLAALKSLDGTGDPAGFRSAVVSILFESDGGGAALSSALERVRSEVSKEIAAGANVIILSDRGFDSELAPIPSVLAVSAVHHHLVREKTRTSAGIVVEAGDARECHQLCLLLGFGANAINPYLALATVGAMVHAGEHGLDPTMGADAAAAGYIAAAGSGILKVMSKMGISTVASYTGAQIFEAIGISREVIGEYFSGTASRLGGVDLDVVAKEVRIRHRAAPSR